VPQLPLTPLTLTLLAADPLPTVQLQPVLVMVVD
jgi:hypothetical protein